MPDEGRMPFLAHLEELRKRLIISFSVIGVAFVLAFNVRE
jgi:Sec-independent protein secretion pathway component TatC